MASEKTIDRAAIRAASEIKPAPNAKSHPDVIVLDTETTGFVAGRDHLLTVVCYNAGFDLKFLEADGFTYPDEVSDVMLDFAEIYGEYDSRHHDYKWQKLVKCAEYYGCPEFEAHNSLGDAQATAWCWRHVQRDMLSRGGCDLEAEARDASDASRCRSGAIKADRDRVVR